MCNIHVKLKRLVGKCETEYVLKIRNFDKIREWRKSILASDNTKHHRTIRCCSDRFAIGAGAFSELIAEPFNCLRTHLRSQVTVEGSRRATLLHVTWTKNIERYLIITKYLLLFAFIINANLNIEKSIKREAHTEYVSSTTE